MACSKFVESCVVGYVAPCQFFSAPAPTEWFFSEIKVAQYTDVCTVAETFDPDMDSLVSRPNPLTRKGCGVTSLNPWACRSVEAL